MEKDDEVSGDGNAYTAMFWEYDPRLGRRWNVDPITFPWQSGYSVFNNQPVYYTDPLGLYGTKRESNQMKRAAKRNGETLADRKSYNTREDGSGEWGFNRISSEGEVVGTFSKKYFGEKGVKISDPSNLGRDKNLFVELISEPISGISGDLQSIAQLFSFFSGLGKEKTYYGPKSGYSEQMTGAPMLFGIIDEYIISGEFANGEVFIKGTDFSPQKINKDFEQFKKDWNEFGAKVHKDIVTNANLPRLSIGGYSVVIQPTDAEGIVNISLRNGMTKHSFFLHSDKVKNKEKGTLGTINMKIDLGLFDIRGFIKE